MSSSSAAAARSRTSPRSSGREQAVRAPNWGGAALRVKSLACSLTRAGRGRRAAPGTGAARARRAHKGRRSGAASLSSHATGAAAAGPRAPPNTPKTAPFCPRSPLRPEAASARRHDALIVSGHSHCPGTAAGVPDERRALRAGRQRVARGLAAMNWNYDTIKKVGACAGGGAGGPGAPARRGGGCARRAARRGAWRHAPAATRPAASWAPRRRPLQQRAIQAIARVCRQRPRPRRARARARLGGRQRLALALSSARCLPRRRPAPPPRRASAAPRASPRPRSGARRRWPRTLQRTSPPSRPSKITSSRGTSQRRGRAGRGASSRRSARSRVRQEGAGMAGGGGGRAVFWRRRRPRGAGACTCAGEEEPPLASSSTTNPSPPPARISCPWPGAVFPEVCVWILDKRGLMDQASRAGRARAFDVFFEQQRRACAQMLRVRRGRRRFGRAGRSEHGSGSGLRLSDQEAVACSAASLLSLHAPPRGPPPAAHPQIKHPGVVRVLEPMEESSGQVGGRAARGQAARARQRESSGRRRAGAAPGGALRCPLSAPSQTHDPSPASPADRARD
jgi:hypothetical protein